MEKFRKLGICENVLKVLSNKKFTKPSEIQEKTIPLVLEGKDIIAGSATGSGKTLAFGAGMIKNTSRGKGIQGLILTPTRELCEQVADALREFSYYKDLEITPVYGGVPISHQIKKLGYSDIVVATPGRLLDHIKRNSIDLSKINFLVLDEADRMWDMGFKHDVAKIISKCPKEKQTLLFSATISRDLSNFSSKYMKNPAEIEIDNYVDTSKLKQIYYDIRDSEKFSLLTHLLGTNNSGLSMVFCNTRRNADFVEKNLRKNDINARAIHGGMDQKKRIRVLKGFSDGKIQVIVCTDVAARGLDISGVGHVYNYDLPKDPRDYIHRIGRTARAGESGLAINIVASRDYDNFSNILRKNEGLVVKRTETPHFKRVRIEIIERNNWNRRDGNSHRNNSRNSHYSGNGSGQRTMRRSRGAMSNGRRGSGNSFTKRIANGASRK